MTTADPTSVLTLSSSSCNGVLDTDGLLRIRTGESNRLELDKTLDELTSTSELQTGLTSGSVTDSSGTYDGYEFTINGKKFDFKKDTELNTVINTINNDTTANVTVSYSQTLNQFRIVSDDTGAQGNVSVTDTKGNLATALFGIGTQPSVTSNTLSTTSDGKYTHGTYNYTVSLGDGTSKDINFVVDSSNDSSISALQTTIQSSIDAKIGSGKVTIGNSDSKLTFQSTSGSTLKIAADSASSDILGIGTSGISSEIGTTSGQDLNMNVNLGGTAQTITRSTNSFTLDGITMNINGTLNTNGVTTDPKIKFTASGNVDDLYKKISDFVTQYNAIIDKVNTDVTQMPPSAGYHQRRRSKV